MPKYGTLKRHTFNKRITLLKGVGGRNVNKGIERTKPKESVVKKNFLPDGFYKKLEYKK